MIIWIASYPRSGNTLLRTICRHCFNVYSYADEPIQETGFLANPGLGGHLEYKSDWPDFYQKASQSEKYFLIKTHSLPLMISRLSILSVTADQRFKAIKNIIWTSIN